MRCDECGWRHDDAPDWAHTLNHNILTLGKDLEIIMSQQDEINADVTALTGVVTTLQTADTNIAAEIAALEAQVAAGQPVDLSGLKSAVAGVSDAANALAAIAPAAPSTPVDTGTGDDGSAPSSDQPSDGSQPTA